MFFKKPFWLFVVFSFLFILLLSSTGLVGASASAQQPTVQIPTVTSSPTGPLVSVPGDQGDVNVRSGPGIFYPKVGVLLVGQKAVAKGRSAGGDWILIVYDGVQGGTAWVYAPYVTITPGQLPIVEPPPTPTPNFTATIDPTLAAQFVKTLEPTRLPTFTEPAPLVISTFPPNSVSGSVGGIPMALIIISMVVAGILIGLFTITRGR